MQEAVFLDAWVERVLAPEERTLIFVSVFGRWCAMVVGAPRPFRVKFSQRKRRAFANNQARC